MRYHLIALATIMVWGTTFVSTRVLLDHGLSPSCIFILRFAIAYAGMLLFSHRRWMTRSWRDEALAAVCGVTGGSAYFLTENTALSLAPAGVVSFIVALAPLLTLLVALFLPGHRRPGLRLTIGSVIAFIGVGAIVSGDRGGGDKHVVTGGALALSAALLWAVYQNVVGPLSTRYGAAFLTRKVFGYGLLTILIYEGVANLAGYNTPLWPDNVSVLCHTTAVWGNILFLGLVASLLCYFTWNKAVEHLGGVVSANYIYLNPLTTCVFSALFLSERFTPLMATGGIGILAGLYIALARRPGGLSR